MPPNAGARLFLPILTVTAFARRGPRPARGPGIAGLTFHDLRGPAVVRPALAKATVPQIATFTGHSLEAAALRVS
jgi:hypothetical protein